MILWMVLACADTVICAPGYGASDAGVCVPVQDSGAPSGAAAAAPALPDAAPPLTAGEAAAAMQAGLDAGLVEPRLLGDRWRASIDAGRGGGCPVSGGYSLLQGVRGCTAPSGTTFAGPAEWTDSTVGEGFRLEVDSYIRRPDGTQLAYTGLVDFEHTVDGGIPSWRAEAEGSFVDDAADGWLGEGASADVFAKLTGSGADAALQMTGGSSVGLSTVLFEDFTWDRTCGSQGGVVSLDSAGRAYRLELDCGTCGPVLLGAEVLGDACVDLAALEAFVALLEAP